MLTNNKWWLYTFVEAIARPRICVPNTDPTNSYFYTHIELHPHITYNYPHTQYARSIYLVWCVKQVKNCRSIGSESESTCVIFSGPKENRTLSFFVSIGWFWRLITKEFDLREITVVTLADGRVDSIERVGAVVLCKSIV